MSWGKFLLWSSVLSLPTLFLFPKRKPGVVLPGPEELGPDGEPIVLEPSEPPLPFENDAFGDFRPGSAEVDTIPAEFRNFQPPAAIAGYARMKAAEVPATILPQLRTLLSGSLGTVTKLPTDGRDIAAVIEPHFHEPGGPTKPWGWHKGVSLYERKGTVA